MLSPADVRALYVTPSAALDVSAQMSDVTPTPTLAVDTIRAAGNTGVLRWCAAIDWTVPARKFFVDDTLRAISAADGDGWLAVLYSDPAPSLVTGLLLPVRLSEDAVDMLNLPNGSLAGSAVIWEPDAARLARYIVGGIELAADGDHTVPAGAAGREYQLITAAGDVGGAARTVGIRDDGDITAGASESQGDTARGWRLRTTPVGRN